LKYTPLNLKQNLYIPVGNQTERNKNGKYNQSHRIIKGLP
jgi:hypothetical protein